MGIISWIILGLLAGAIAKAILPGRQGGGWLVTLILGIVGALVGGFLGGAIFGMDSMNEFWSLKTWVFAILGSLLVLVVWGFITGRNKKA